MEGEDCQRHPQLRLQDYPLRSVPALTEFALAFLLGMVSYSSFL
jgi:hypothetical protein